MNFLDSLILYLVLLGTLGLIILLIYLPAIISNIRVKLAKRDLDRQIALLPEVFKNCVQIVTEPLGLGSMECESTGVKFEDVHKNSKLAVEVVLNLINYNLEN